jgi:hypothetical protein
VISAHSVREYRTEHRKTRTILRFGGLLYANTLFMVLPSVVYLGEAMSFSHMHSLAISHPLGNVSPVITNFKYLKRVQQASHCRSDPTPIHETFTRSSCSHVREEYLQCAPIWLRFTDISYFLHFPRGFLEVFNYFESTWLMHHIKWCSHA